MKSLIGKYINLLSKENISVFLNNNNIYLDNKELNYIYNLVKENWENIIINENLYINDMYNNINKLSSDKIKDLFYYYKGKYKDLI